ncbi:juvenile hormone acid O-methyltransferase [Venturia canescens]|uniref:juvenile hormone acid O-methyltransferase n=1 Tax=Venturia canescens TaxID=32260 RepID=UPI001C9CD29B|nr:juvenile hormone acid O-methyltransferase [Venturia canescens]
MENVNEYAVSNDLQRRDALDTIEEFADEIASMHGRCLDIGCGPGIATKDIILPRLPSDAVLTGADISKAMIKSARSYCANEPRLSFVELDVETDELPIHEIGQYDNVLSFYCLHWCQDTKQTYENIYKLLRPGGTGLIMFLSFNDGFDAYIRMRDNSRYTAYMQDASKYVPAFHNCPNPRANLKKILEDVGFEVLHCSNREKSFIYKDMKTLQKHAIAVNPFYNRIPDNLKEEYTEEMTREIARRKILLETKNNQVPKEYSVLDRYRILIAYFKKPEKADEIR